MGLMAPTLIFMQLPTGSLLAGAQEASRKNWWLRLQSTQILKIQQRAAPIEATKMTTTHWGKNPQFVQKFTFWNSHFWQNSHFQNLNILGFFFNFRYFITYHQWNSKPEFIFATHNVISYKNVLDDLKERSNLIDSQSQPTRAGPTASDASEKSYVQGPSSPTWSSKSSMCGSTGTGMTSRQSQSSCRLSGYSDQVSHIGNVQLLSIWCSFRTVGGASKL